MKPLANYAEDATVVVDFNVFDSNGEPGALTGTLTEAVEIYKSGSSTPHTGKYTPAVLNSLTGVYRLNVDMSAHAFFEVGKDYTAILTGAGITASGTAVTNTVLARWSCQNQVAEAPDGSLDADKFATGVLVTDADIADAVWAEDIGSPTLNSVKQYLATNIPDAIAVVDANVDSILSDTNAILLDTGTQGVLLAANAIGDAVIQDGAITANKIATDAITAAKIATGAIDGDALATGALDDIAAAVHIGTIITGTADTGATSTLIPFSAIAPTLTVADQLVGRVLIFKTDTSTAELRGQAATISASTTSSISVISAEAFTTAPASGDTFVVV